jgi:hypothetical protein
MNNLLRFFRAILVLANLDNHMHSDQFLIFAFFSMSLQIVL